MRTMTLFIGIALLLSVASLASAQQDVTETSIEFEHEEGISDPEKGHERGAPKQSSFVRVHYCWGSPGLNPNEGQVTATIAVSSEAEWVTVRPFDDGDESVSWTAGGGNVAFDDDCAPKHGWEVKYDIADDAPWEAESTIDWTVTVTEDDDIGTYQSVAQDESDSYSVRVQAQPIDEMTGEPIGDDDDDDDDSPPETDPEEGPAVAPFAVLVTLGLFAALRRRI